MAFISGSFLILQVKAQEIFTAISEGNTTAINTYKGDINVQFKTWPITRNNPVLKEIESLNPTPLQWAIYESNLPIIRLLIEKGASTNVRGSSIEIIDQSGITVSIENCLNIAIFQSKIDVVKYLIEELKVDINAQEYNDFTKKFDKFSALHTAAFVGNAEITKYLLDKGANINPPTFPSNETPLIFSLNRKFENVAILLIGRGAYVNKISGTAASPLYWAVFNGLKKATKAIREKGGYLSTIELEEIDKLLKERFNVTRFEDL